MTTFGKLLALAFLSLLAGCGEPAPVAQPPAAETQALPPLIDLAGTTLRPFERPETKAVAMIFILPDCPIANSYLPALQRMHAEFGKQGVQFLLVQADPATTAEQARAHAKEYAIEIPVILDANHAWVQRAGATRTPEAVVFSPAGEILYRGRIDDQYVGLGQKRPQPLTHELHDALAAIVAGQSVPNPRTDAVGCYIPELPKGR